jgi:hypothetical protein
MERAEAAEMIVLDWLFEKFFLPSDEEFSWMADDLGEIWSPHIEN